MIGCGVPDPAQTGLVPKHVVGAAARRQLGQGGLHALWREVREASQVLVEPAFVEQVASGAFRRRQ